ncbi:hypothetical protein BKN38_07475 [Helicobacter sp. CLO-3]|nr:MULTISPECIES: acyltransferase [unclassified Helicobacter]OHU82269.1 hypothetical protein BKN38_07475 [Helicobacter sp. CLO-3]
MDKITQKSETGINTNQKPIHLGALDSFRGIAAISVVLFHLLVLDSVSRFEFFKNAWLFVPFFFVLSGFVMPYVYDRNTFSFRRFIIARSFRILPLYWVAFIAVFALECLRYLAYHKFGMLKNEPFTGSNDFSEIIPHLLLLQSWLNSSSHVSFNAPAWSLSVEWYLYVAFGLLMFVPRLTRYALFALLSTLAYFHLFDFFKIVTSSGIMYFFSGCLMYFIFDRLKNTHINSIIFTILEVCVLTLCFVVIYFGLDKYALFAFDALVLVFALSSYSRKTYANNKFLGGGVITSFLETKVFAFFGALSYAIYITHWFCLSISDFFVRKVVAKFGIYVDYADGTDMLVFANAITANIYILATICFIVFIAYLAHNFIEKPCINYGKKLLYKS